MSLKSVDISLIEIVDLRSDPDYRVKCTILSVGIKLYYAARMCSPCILYGRWQYNTNSLDWTAIQLRIRDIMTGLDKRLYLKLSMRHHILSENNIDFVESGAVVWIDPP